MQDILKKFKFRDTAVVLNASPSLENEFEKNGFKLIADKKIKSTNTLVFINNKKEYLDFLKTGLSTKK